MLSSASALENQMKMPLLQIQNGVPSSVVDIKRLLTEIRLTRLSDCSFSEYHQQSSLPARTLAWTRSPRILQLKVHQYLAEILIIIEIATSN